MRPDAPPAGTATPGRHPLWLVALLPLVLLALLVGFIVWSGPAGMLRGDDHPPVERLTFQRVELGPDGILVSVMNDGPDPVTIAQVMVDEAFWTFTAEGGTRLPRLGRTRLAIPYPWVHGDTHVVRILTSTGVTFDREIGVAVETPRPGMRFFAIFTLIGVYVGVIPVALGLLWFPLMRRLGRAGLDFVLALTIGLLLFLLIEAVQEGLAAAGAMPASFQGAPLFAFGALGAYLGLEAVSRWLRRRRAHAAASAASGWVLALLVAVGIGLHNFGEGLAIGAAFSLGEAALGTLLIIGFTLHNTTEGLAIVAPLARERAGIADLAQLGAIGGVPTIAGAWLGGFVYSPVWSVLFLAVGSGAIAQVVVQIARQMAGDEPMAGHFATAPVLSGMLAGFAVMFVTGAVVG